MYSIFPSTSANSVLQLIIKIKCLGYKAIIFDIDSTLVPHGNDTNKEIENLFKYLHELGIKTLLLSNNSEKRISTFNRNINTLLYLCKANYLKALKMLDVNSSEVILIGDQLFTDIMGANLCNIKSVLVKF